MSKKRGMSLEEKRKKMTDLFYETKDFFTLKELERLCYKEKGIPSMTVKDVLMSLVYDGVVDSDKIGTSVYFWAFPSKASQNQEIVQEERRLQNLQNALKDSSAGKEDTPERRDALSKLIANETCLEELKDQLSSLEKYHPDRLNSLQAQAAIAVDAANRWTDNVFQITSWLKERFGVEESVLTKQFGIPDDFDYVEL